jgi:hypothetical protein
MFSGLYYKHVTIVNYTSSVIKKLEAFHTDDARVIIYDRHVFIVQATGRLSLKIFQKVMLQEKLRKIIL